MALVALPLSALAVKTLPGTTKATVSGPPRVESAAIPGPVVEGRLRQTLPLFDALRGGDERPSVPRPPVSYFTNQQIVSIYGNPHSETMGELGRHSPEGAAAFAAGLAAEYDALNGDRSAIGALHLIVDTAQPRPGADGSYILHMPFEEMQPYIDVAESAHILLFFDLQIGWGDPREAVDRLRPFMKLPFTHISLDPEFSLRKRGVAPGDKIGSLDAARINEVQLYLADVVREYGLPPKILVVHQFLPEMVTNTDAILQLPEVDFTIDMDGFGEQATKNGGYEAYALAPYAQHAAIKLFYHWDRPLFTKQQVMDLLRAPDYIIYQ